MNKIEKIGFNTFDNTNKWFDTTKQEDLNYYTDIFSPWQTKQKLKIWREVEWNSWWWNTNIWYFTFATTWNITITWVWFKPKLVRFTFADQIGWMWSWAMTSSYQFAYDINSKSQIQTQCIYIRNSSWTAIWRAVFVSMDNDWFTINITLASTTIYVNYECFW